MRDKLHCSFHCGFHAKEVLNVTATRVECCYRFVYMIHTNMQWNKSCSDRISIARGNITSLVTFISAVRTLMCHILEIETHLTQGLASTRLKNKSNNGARCIISLKSIINIWRLDRDSEYFNMALHILYIYSVRVECWNGLMPHTIGASDCLYFFYVALDFSSKNKQIRCATFNWIVDNTTKCITVASHCLRSNWLLNSRNKKKNNEKINTHLPFNCYVVLFYLCLWCAVNTTEDSNSCAFLLLAFALHFLFRNVYFYILPSHYEIIRPNGNDCR